MKVPFPKVVGQCEANKSIPDWFAILSIKVIFINLRVKICLSQNTMINEQDEKVKNIIAFRFLLISKSFNTNMLM